MFPVNLISRFKSFPAYADMRLVENEFEERLIKYFELENCWLNQREQEIIWSFFKDEKTLQKIGDEQFISRERVRQIIAKSVEKLDYFNRKFKWFYDDDKVLEKLVQEKEVKSKQLTSKIIELEELIERARNLYFDENSTIREVKEYLESLESDFKGIATIDDLDLSVRTYNCLRRSGNARIADLLEKKEDDILKIRNLGKKSFKELKEKLNNLGLKFKGEE